MASAFGLKYGDLLFDIDEQGYDNVIVLMTDLLQEIDPDRWNAVHQGYSDLYRNLRFSSLDDKDFLFGDLVDAIDRSCPAGWAFGPEEEFSVLYRFTPDP